MRWRINFITTQVSYNEDVEETINILNNDQSLSSLYSTPKDIWNIIKKLPLTKAPGYDNIPNIAFNHLQKTAITRSTNICNARLRLSSFPIQWKKAIIVMIPKPYKNHEDPLNYRSFSLLSSHSQYYIYYPKFWREYYLVIYRNILNQETSNIQSEKVLLTRLLHNLSNWQMIS